jgi:hypothetical protein
MQKQYRFSTGEITKLIETDVLTWLSFEPATILYIHYRLETQPYGRDVSLNFVNTILSGMRRSGAVDIDMKTKTVSLTNEGRQLFETMCAANPHLANSVARVRKIRDENKAAAQASQAASDKAVQQ